MNTTAPTNLLSTSTPPTDLTGGVGLQLYQATPVRLYADLVFDRPLDLAYTYAVPPECEDKIAVGKRVEAPFGKGDRLAIGYCVRVAHEAPEHPAKLITRILDDQPLLTEPILRLTRWMADYYVCGWGQVLHAVVPAGVRDQAGLREAVFMEAVPLAELPRGLPTLTDKQMQALQLLRQQTEPIEQRDLTRQARSGPGPVYELVRKGYARVAVKTVERFGGAVPGGPAQPALALNAEQAAAWQTIQAAMNQQSFQAILLHGVTGSGKTEIYLRAIEAVVARGQQALVLVPEISLTPQTIERFRGRCGDIAVMHSHLTDAERGSHWRRVFFGRVPVVVGARSAVFAPTRQLGLIVIDEEHETSFKQEATPRYHARDVAVMRARLENIPILLGSATPALESWHNAQRGHYTLVSLTQRVADRPLPRVELVDLRNTPPRGKFHAISPDLEAAMKTALNDGGQVMLFLNRRGYAPHVHCALCGFVANCTQCDLSLTYHKARGALLCHHCGIEARMLKVCPQCVRAGKTEQPLKYQGQGTEKLQAEVQEKFPGKIVQRMDRDTMAQPGSHERVLQAFRAGAIHILLGTQMIAKGLDFPNVTLVGVINADSGLHLPDFRSAERTFQLLAQVSGRAGRGERGGKVLVQTFNPEHPCIQLAQKHDYLGFVARELTFRKLHDYPPYHRLARLIVRSPKQTAAAAFADLLAGAFEQAQRQQSGVRLLGPAEAPVFKLNNYYRYHFQLQSASPVHLHRILRQVLGSVRAPNSVEYQLDIDPFNML
jgi:primosomal protein N' (replication factor Y)